MKVFVLAFFMVVTVICGATAQSYDTGILQCDKNYDQQSKNGQSTISIIAALSEHTDCYKKIVFKIIDSEYAQNADKMKQNFTDYINLAGEMVEFVSRPDSCYPRCGTVIGIDAATARRDAAQNYLNAILKRDEPI